MDETIIIILLIGLVVSAVICVFIRNLLKASIMMAVISAVLAILMFLLGAPLAAVFELSVCSGLITVIFISAISMTRVRSKEEEAQRVKNRRRRFFLLPVLLIVLTTGLLFFLWPHLAALIPNAAESTSAVTEADVFWIERPADLVGQIIIVLAGVFGILIFFKEHDK